MGSTGQIDGGIPAQVQTLHLSDLLAQLKWPFCSYGDPLSAFTSTVKYSLRHSQLKKTKHRNPLVVEAVICQGVPCSHCKL